MKKVASLLFLLLLGINSCLLAQQKLADPVVGLQEYMGQRPQEKVHLQFDKPFYSVGDTVWFKAYLVNAQGNQLSAGSKVLHLDLQTPKGELKQLLLPLTAGMAAGQLVLNDSLYQAGDYPLRAYTQLMRNNSDDYFFNSVLRVGDVLHSKINVAAAFVPSAQALTATLTYSQANGDGLGNQEINYQLKQDKKILFADKAKTDAQGKMGVNFPVAQLPAGQLELLANATLGSGVALQNQFSLSMPKIALQFFPEGGAMVMGLRSKLGLKALGSSGLGVIIKGHVLNQNGEEVALFETAHAGMGTFALLPQAGATYTAIITEGPYKGERFELPKALAEGYLLAVNAQKNGDLQVRISRPTAMLGFETVKLVAQANGELLQALDLPMKAASISFLLPKAQLAVGINQLTLFSPSHVPLAERLVFIQDEGKATAALNSDKTVYQTRDQVKMKLAVADEKGAPVVGGYSVAVIKSSQNTLPQEGQLSIQANLLLSSELKGHIETPNYYFIAPDAQKLAELDALMLTQGWRRFSWTEVLTGQAAAPLYSAEQDLSISGQVTTMAGKPVPGAKVTLVAAKAMLFLDTLADAQGRFRFNALDLADSVTVLIRARGAKESSNVKIKLDEMPEMGNFRPAPEQPMTADTAMRTYLNQTAGLFEQMEKTGKIIQGTTLKTVEIVTKRRPEIKNSVYPFAAAPPDYTLEPDKLQEMNDLMSYLRGRFMGVTILGDSVYGYYQGKRGKMVILLNGTVIEDLSGINPKSLTGVQIIKGGVVAGNMATALMLDGPEMYNQSAAFGIVFLTMGAVDAKFIKAKRPTGFRQEQLTGYTYAKEFYAPRYQLQKELPKTDYRSTLYWQPNVVTGTDGTAVLDFYTADELGQYQVTLEGVGANGQLTRKVVYFEVK